MAKRGPKPKDDEERKSYQITLRMPSEMRRILVTEVNKRKLANPDLPLNWGLSEYVREVLARHIDELKMTEH